MTNDLANVEAADEECILACIDDSPYSAPVVQLAAWAAQRLGLPVEILRVVQRHAAVARRRDLSGAIGLGVKSALLEELTEMEERSARLEVEHGRLLLEAARETALAAGAPSVRLLHRHGGIVETILEREVHARCVVIGRRGASHRFAQGHIGSKVERVVRASDRPVLVAGLDGSAPRHIVIAYDGSEAADLAIDRLLQSPAFAGLPATMVTVGADDAVNRRLLDEGSARLAGSFAVTRLLERGDPEEVLPAIVARTPGAMLVMGAYGHSPLRSLIVGSTTTALVRTVEAPVLLVRKQR
ncbi:universal stress protein [Croceicoccus sp. F390]|uniref:Universal stress protein n=1 Tax=Croceicoccus esteveae TaxID=3075597 RepID=A0ABU2ZG50_9SPHN|nr:universal stress protein [Croceicoccus sp. F390]MDT0575563.1 universal stress protein [Croceicoccus sp. F390]